MHACLLLYNWYAMPFTFIIIIMPYIELFELDDASIEAFPKSKAFLHEQVISVCCYIVYKE